MIDEFTRQCLAIRAARRLNSAHVIELLGDCMLAHGVPEHVRSDNGAEMTARRVKRWLASVGTKPLFIEPGSPWEMLEWGNLLLTEGRPDRHRADSTTGNGRIAHWDIVRPAPVCWIVAA